MALTAEQLLAGADLVFEVAVPGDVLDPGEGAGDVPVDASVKLRPLRISDLQVVARAAGEQQQLFATLMVQRALVEPSLSVVQVAALHAGLVHFLLDEVNRLSGLDGAADAVAGALEAPLAQAAFVLSREFGWTPAEVNDLTLGQVMLHLEMLHRQERR